MPIAFVPSKLVPIMLPMTRLPVDPVPASITPIWVLPEMTFGVVPPIVLFAASLISTPMIVLPSGASPLMSVPIMSPKTWLPVAVGPSIQIPAPSETVPLPETTLPGPTTLPAASEIKIPAIPLPIAFDPARSVPIRSPWIMVRVDPPWTTTPTEPLPEITLAAPPARPPMAMSVAPRSTRMPSLALPIACEPPLSVPIELPKMVSKELASRSIPSTLLPEITLPGPMVSWARRRWTEIPSVALGRAAEPVGIGSDEVAEDEVRDRQQPAELDPEAGVAGDHVGLAGGQSADGDVGAEDQDAHAGVAGCGSDRRRRGEPRPAAGQSWRGMEPSARRPT